MRQTDEEKVWKRKELKEKNKRLIEEIYVLKNTDGCIWLYSLELAKSFVEILL